MMNVNPGGVNRYELQELLGQGGTIEVWKAFDTQTSRYVAIKFLRANVRTDPDFVPRFQREGQLLLSLRHPNIVPCQNFFVSQPPGMGSTTAYVVMDYVEGGTLVDYIRNTSRQGKFLATADIVRLFTSICAGVDYAHQLGVFHGQLKPTNILFDKRNTSRNPMGEPVITDFGMMRLLSTTVEGGNGWWLGTPLYTSPEQIMGSPGDARSDIYSLGVMLYEVCTGTPPFPGNNPATIMMQQINTIPASPALINPHLPLTLVAIIMRSIAKEPSLRFPTVSAMVAELAQVGGQRMQEAGGFSDALTARMPDALANSVDLPTMVSMGHISPIPETQSSSAMPSLTEISGASSSPAFSSSGIHGGYNPISSYPGVAGPSQSYPVFVPGEPATPLPSGQSAQRSFVAPNSSPPGASRPRRRRLWVVLSVLLVLLVVGSALGTYLLFFARNAAEPVTMAGHAYFVSSGLLSSTTESGQGITDQLELRLEHVPLPPTGENYYAWLLNDKTQSWLPIPLGALTVNNGTISFAFQGNSTHSDLLATNSRFLVTLETVGSIPDNPSSDLRYYGEFSQVPNPADPDHYSLYDHIRHLLADDPKVKASGLSGGLDIWLYRNTEKILEWAGSARDADSPGTLNVGLIHRQLVRIIDYLDGTYYNTHDLPNEPLYVDDPTTAKIGLLTFDPVNQNPPGYLSHIQKHLHEISLLPQTDPEQRAIANQVYEAFNAVKAWDEEMRTDVLQLYQMYQMDQAKLTGSQGLTLLNRVATLANRALVGQRSPEGQVTPGVAQIHYLIQRLATFDLQECTSAHPCPALV